MPRARSGEREGAIPLAHALALGTLHGPTELLPVSSSGHLTLLPWLLGWNWEVDDEVRKAFEVTLHGGAAAALLVALRGELVPRTPRHCVVLALSVAPAALVGLTVERPIERHLGTPTTVALGLLVGALALVCSDRAAQTRRHEDAGPGDAFWLGLAQACALFPGVSRNGATLAAARLRLFARADASLLSRELALPVIAGAAVLKGTRVRRRRLPPAARAPFVAGAVASFASTLASRPLFRLGTLPLAPYAAYRIVLAAAVLARARKARPPAPSFSRRRAHRVGEPHLSGELNEGLV